MTCDVHALKMHRPAQLDNPDLHHVVPREWQRAWQPATAPYPGTYAGESLWDARGVKAPPTCHHNVHHWIVALMHWVAANGPQGPLTDAAVVDAAVKALRSTNGLTARSYGALELACASEGPRRFIAAGGDLRVLISGHLWGAI